MRSIYLATAYSYKSDSRLFSIISKLSNYQPFKFIVGISLALRSRKITKVCAKIMSDGNIVFSPITHSHYIAVLGNLPALSHTFWLEQDKFWVDACDEIWVFDGLPWETSYGVKREIEWGLEQKKPVRFVNKQGKPGLPITSAIKIINQP